ncbi:MAG TPA: serine hydrolase domain-containing protein [Thermoanaerobaculia bacterium]
MEQESLTKIFERWDRAGSPGCSVAVYRDGEIVWSRGFGTAHLEHGVPIATDTVFHVASLSKMFTAYAIALLAHDGALSLDDDIRTFIPELAPGPRITLRNIVHHTSGLRDQWDLLRMAGWRYPDLKTNADILRLATRQRELNFEPGTRFQYINTGYTLMGIAIERITGATLREFAAQRIFEPLGMRDTQFHDDATRIIPKRAQAYRMINGSPTIDMPAYETVGPTSLLSTVDDFARWEQYLLTGELRELLTTSGTLADGTEAHYGFGLILGQYRGVPVVEHAGGDAGYRAHYLRVPSERFAVAVFANTLDVEPGARCRDVADAMLTFPEQTVDRAMPAWAGRAAGIASPDPEDLLAKSGTYRDTLSGMTCRIEPRGGRLFLTSDSGGDYELAPVTRDRYRFLIVDAECVFENERVRMFYGGNEQASCVRIEEESQQEAAPLDDYVATYASDELESRYTIDREDALLVLRRPRIAPAALQPLGRDEFATSDGLQLRFVRNGDGNVHGMTVSAERVWNVRFSRAADRA